MRHAHVLGLAAVDTAAQCPAAGRIGTIVHIPAFTKKALAAKGFDIDRYPVAGLSRSNGRADLFHDAYHFVTDGNARNGARHAAVLDMQVASTDAAQRYAHNGVARIFQLRLRLVQ